MQETLAWLDGQLPYARACAVLEELSGVPVSTSSNWRIGQAYGAVLQATQAAETTAQQAQARAWSTPGPQPAPEDRMGVALDGAMMHIRQEGWKEFKVGVVFEVEPREHCDPQTGDCAMQGHALNNSYVAHLGGPEAVGWQTWTEAHRRGWQQACDTVVLGDGAPWIWNLHQEHFHSSVAIVDWYHATEHLGATCQLLYPDGGAIASRWYNAQETALFQGHAGQIAQAIQAHAARESDPDRAADIQTAAGYFKHYRDHMLYHDFRLEGWPIGSGMVESAAKQFKARVTGPGMQWSRAGAQNILALRAAVLTGRDRFAALCATAPAISPPT